ncbi:Chaperone DnaJ [Parasponia andersonii]|nr:Chaperone DnaJ [Parasponia andersonii]
MNSGIPCFRSCDSHNIGVDHDHDDQMSPGTRAGNIYKHRSADNCLFPSSYTSNSPLSINMFSNSYGTMKPPPVEKKLECTLEELCYGCQKKIKITRDVVKDTGGICQEEELLTIKVKPGWRKGTKITFEGMGNEKPGSNPADVIFVIAKKRHQFFRREGDDLEFAVEFP